MPLRPPSIGFRRISLFCCSPGHARSARPLCWSIERRSVTLDDLDQRQLARTDPKLFLQRHPPPLIIDEVQYAPELFSAIKVEVDRAREPGLYWLTGSQKFHLMQGISESLAGRVAILDLLGVSRAELAGRAADSTPLLLTGGWIEGARSRALATSLPEVYRAIWRSVRERWCVWRRPTFLSLSG